MAVTRPAYEEGGPAAGQTVPLRPPGRPEPLANASGQTGNGYDKAKLICDRSGLGLENVQEV